MSNLIKCEDCGKEISKNAAACPNCGRPMSNGSHAPGAPILPPKQTNKKHIGCIPSLAIIIFVLWIVTKMSGPSDVPSNSATSPNKKDVAIGLVGLDYEWTKAGFGGVMEATFTIDNKADHDIKDVEITCTHYASSGTKIDSNKKVIYEIIKKHSKKSIQKFNMGFIHSQAMQTSCKVTDLSFT